MKTGIRLLATGTVAVMALFATACSGPEGSDNKDPNGPEKTNIKVGALPTWDAAALYLGVKKGYFQAEGLEVTPVLLANSEEAVSRSMSGAVDITHNGYVSPIIAANKGLKLRIIVDGSQARPDMYVIVAPKNSTIHAPKDLAGKTIGMINSKGLPAMLTTAALQAAGIDPKSTKFVDVNYPNMGAALQRGSIDASFATDPFLTQFEQTLGVHVVLDTINGPTAGFPIGCYQTSERFAKQNPKTIASFQRAMAKAQALATSDPSEVAQVLPTYIKGLTPQTAQTIKIGTFSTSLDKSRAQRVADFMTQQHLLSGHFDVSAIVQ
jgi:NitT/TauT family transport system substrate-binding protein